MGSRLCKSELQRWLAGQRESEKVIAKERVQSLRDRSPDEAWTVFLSLTNSVLGSPPDPSEPSYVLMAMRRAMERRSHTKRLAS
jgi:hypothetical protein